MQVYNTSLNIFEPTPVEVGVEKYDIVHYSAIPPINNMLVFEVPATGSGYINLKKTQLRLRFRITNSDGTLLTPGTEDAREERAVKGDIVTVNNLPLSLFFRQVDLCLNDVNINTDIGSNYPYKGYIDMLLDSTRADLESTLQTELCYTDTIGFPQGDYLSNYGFTNRYGYTKDSASVMIKGPIRTDICQQDRLILPGVRISLKMYPTNDAFRLQNMLGKKKTYKLELLEAALEVYKVIPTSMMVETHNETLKLQPSILPFTKSHIRNYNIQTGQQSFSTDDLFYDKIPDELIVCMVESKAYNGDFLQNPLVFEHFNVSYLEYQVNGVSVPGPALTPNFEDADFMDCYSALLDGESNGVITRDAFEDGYTIFKFRVKENSGMSADDKCKKGHSRLKLKFRDPLMANVTLLVYGKFKACVKIDNEKKVTVHE